MSKEVKKKDDSKEVDEKPEKELMVSASSSRHAVEWFGAIFFYLKSLGKKPFDQFYTKKKARKNRITGYFIQLIIFFLVCSLVVFISVKCETLF